MQRTYTRILLIIVSLFICGLKISIAQYCIPEYTNNCSTGAYINKFIFHTLNNSTSGCSGNPNNFILYPTAGNTTTAVVLGGTYALSVKSNNDDGIGVWIDYNDDGDFEDANEFIYTSPFYDNILFSATVIIPNNAAYVGERRLRVRGVLQSLLFSNNCCGLFASGETEDYTITINPAPPCNGMPVAGTVTAFPTSICAEGNTTQLHLSGYTVASGINIEWQSSQNDIDWSTTTGADKDLYNSPPLYNSTYFRAKVTCINTGQFAYSNELKINIGEVKILSVVNDTLCGQGITQLQVLSNGTTVSWFETETASLPVHSGPFPFNFSTFVTNTTTYYASAASGVLYVDSVGMKDNTTGSGSDAYQNNYLVFNILHACKLSGLNVYPSADGMVIVRLRDQNFSTIRTDTFTIVPSQVNQRTFLELNYNLEPGNGFQITLMEGSVPLWSNQSGVNFPYEIPYVLSLYTSNLGPNYYFYFYDWLVNYTEQCETPRVPVTALVSNAPTVTIATTPTNATICGNAGLQVEITANAGYSNYSWSPSSGLSSATGINVIATPLVTTTYTVIATDSICENTASVTVVIANTPSVIISTTADSICAGTSTQLFATATPLQNYEVSEIDFSPETGNGIPVILDEDEVSPPLQIGFPFKFFGNYYNTFSISSNGFITFDSASVDGCCTGQKLPDFTTPNNLVAFAWEDLSPQLGGSISYFISGSAPYRELIVSFDQVPHYIFNSSGDPVTAQIKLFESSNVIEIHTTFMPGNPAGAWSNHTMGIENSDGTLSAAVPGRNGNNTWTATNDAWRFSPIEYSYLWSPAGSLNDPSFSNPVATPMNTTDYFVVVQDTNTQCSTTATFKIKAINDPTAGVILPAFEAFCDEGSDTLSLIGYTSGASIQWLSSVTSGGPYDEINGATHPIYITQLVDTATYFIAKVACTNVTYANEAILQVLPVPDPPSVDSVFRCGKGKVDLVAYAAGGVISWYDAETGGNYLGQGSTFTTQTLNQSTLFWAEEGPAPAAPLPSTFIGGNIDAGNMFSINALDNIVITGFDGHISTGQIADIEVYYKEDAYAGFENDPGAWTLLGTANGVSGQGTGVPTQYPLSFNLTIPEGKTYSFYITSKTNVINYTYGTQEESVFAFDGNIQIREGISIAFPFGEITKPVQWNGIIHYYTLGCASVRTPVNAIVYFPQLSGTAINSSICKGDSVILTVQNMGLGDFNYQWLPLFPGMIPPDGIGDTIKVTPDESVTFTLTASGINAVCDTQLFVQVVVHLLPVAYFTGLPDTVDVADAPYMLSGFPTGGTFSGTGIIGNVFDPTVAGTGGPYPITYTITDSNGCFDDTVINTVVIMKSGIATLNDAFTFTITPNPSGGMFMISGEDAFTKSGNKITVRDIYGRVVIDQQIKSASGKFTTSFDLTSQPKGNYLVELFWDGKLQRRKLILQ